MRKLWTSTDFERYYVVSRSGMTVKKLYAHIMSKSRCAKSFRTQQRAVINPHDKCVCNWRQQYRGVKIYIYIYIGSQVYIIQIICDKGADIPCAVATVTNNIIPSGVRRRHNETVLRIYYFISMAMLYRCQEKKTRIRVKSLGIPWLA